MTIVTRFAPSPTGFLHIGGARTALFNWLFARHHRGRFLLRIEDTDRARSTTPAIEAILDGLSWLGIDWDDPPIYQSARAAHHQAAAAKLLAAGHAYRCWATPEELALMKEQARAQGRPPRYDGRWRDRDPALAPADVTPVVRLRAPQNGVTEIDDMVQGKVSVGDEQIDDMVLLRADGSPTYMLAVVVDDHDMGVTHVIRGDDHLTNTFRQFHIYTAFGWSPPSFAHIPLIHGPDGAKLSKRHGDLGLSSYRDEGFLPEAMANYLLRLGWSHGDDEIIDREDAVRWFDLDAVGRSPARFDRAKLTSLNAHYIRVADNVRLTRLVMERIAKDQPSRLSPFAEQRLAKGMDGLKERAKTLVELANSASIYAFDDAFNEGLLDLSSSARERIETVIEALDAAPRWDAEALEAIVRRTVAEVAGATLKQFAQPLRLALTGSTVSPPIFQVMDVLGHHETLRRLRRAIDAETSAATNSGAVASGFGDHD